MGAGGLWMPFHCDDKRTNRWALETLDELMSMAKSTQNPLAEIVPTLVLKKESSAPTVEDFASDQYNMDGKNLKSNNIPDWTTDPRIEFQHLTTEMLSWQNNVHKLRIPNASTLIKAGYDYCWFFKPPIVDTTRMLKVSCIIDSRYMINFLS
jgi:D-amino-acid oxidase